MAIKTFSANTTLSSSDVNTYLTNAGLVYVTEKSATSGTTLSIDSCFTTTYDAYRIVISNYKTSSASTSCTFKLRAASTDVSTNYAYGSLTQALYTSTTLSVAGSASTTSFDLMLKADVVAIGAVIDVITPALAAYTTITTAGPHGANTSGQGLKQVSGLHALATAYDGFTLTSAVAFTSITARVYGYRQS